MSVEAAMCCSIFIYGTRKMMIILVLMVKNEEAILTRCLDSVAADAYLIVDQALQTIP